MYLYLYLHLHRYLHLLLQVSSTNDVKIYNLSAGKSLPDWLTERKKRQLDKSDIDVRKRIELIQDFEMPAISDRVKVNIADWSMTKTHLISLLKM